MYISWLGPVQVCSPDSCDNMGVCVQKWNSIKCECNMTSYTGPTCSEGNTPVIQCECNMTSYTGPTFSEGNTPVIYYVRCECNMTLYTGPTCSECNTTQMLGCNITQCWVTIPSCFIPGSLYNRAIRT
jgi:hypothetical protein